MVTKRESLQGVTDPAASARMLHTVAGRVGRLKWHVQVNTAPALIAANPDRILWGSNWPHPGARTPGYVITDLMPWRDIDDAVVLNLLPIWEPDAIVRKKILVDNPARLFGF